MSEECALKKKRELCKLLPGPGSASAGFGDQQSRAQEAGAGAAQINVRISSYRAQSSRGEAPVAQLLSPCRRRRVNVKFNVV